MWKRSVEGGELSLWPGSLTNEYDHLYLLRTISNALSSNSHFVIAVLNTAPTPQSVDVEFSDAFFDQVSAEYGERTIWLKTQTGKSRSEPAVRVLRLMGKGRAW